MFKRILQSWITFVVLILALVWLGLSVVNKRDAVTQVEKELANLESKIDEIESRVQEQSALGAFVGSDTYLERQARLQLNYKKPGEHVVHVQHHQTVATDESEHQDISNARLWWRYVTGQ